MTPLQAGLVAIMALERCHWLSPNFSSVLKAHLQELHCISLMACLGDGGSLRQHKHTKYMKRMDCPWQRLVL